MRAYPFGQVFLTAVLAALLVAGCGGDSGSDDGGGATDTVGGADSVTLPDTAQDASPTVDVKPIEDEQTPPDEDIPTGPCSVDGDPCDDGDPCTEDDRCDAGACVGTAKDCDDGDDCTADACDEATGECVRAPLDVGACDDGDPCTTNDRCDDGLCVGDAPTCDDDNPCTADSCDPATGECTNEPLTGEPCDDGNNCTFNGTCDATGACVGEQIDCDDGVPCTNDVCTPEGLCIHVPAKSNCDDGIACTADLCDPTEDCLHVGVLAAEPVQDGSLGEWPPDGVVATNSLPSGIDGADLRSLSVSVSRTALHIGVEGAAPAGYAWLVYLDLDYAETPEGDGVRDLTTIAGDDPLAAAAAVDMEVGAFGFGADFVVGGFGDDSACLTLAEDGAAAPADCEIAVDPDEKSIEATISWETLFGRAPTEADSWTVGGFAVLADAVSGELTNQALPGQLLPVRRVFFLPVSGGECLAPFCGDYITDPGEVCDDGNDDPTDGCDNCAQPAPPGMVTIPGGEFIMGKDTDRLDDAWRPAHAVWVDTFFIDRYEITAAEFAEFLNAHDFQTGANVVLDDDGNELYQCADTHSLVGCAVGGEYRAEPGFEDHPIGETSWWAAYRYCAWQGKRLPTEAEWEKAARGTDERRYPWGEDALVDAVNCKESTCHDGFETTAPVGSFPDGASPYGVQDMAGNVWEWVNDWFDAGYYAVSPYENPRGPCNGAVECAASSTRIARGGSWDDPFPFDEFDQDRLTTYHRYATQPDCNSDIGIRCAMSPPAQD